MLIYDIHSHLGKTSSGDENTPQELVNDLVTYGISKVGISSLSGISMHAQNDLVHRAMEAYPGVIKGYGFINPKAGDAIDEVNRCLGDYHMDGIKFHSWKHGYYPDNTPALKDIFAEIEKYGKHENEVCIQLCYGNEEVGISIQNSITRFDSEHQKTGIGLQNISIMMEQMDGRMEVNADDLTYCIVLYFPEKKAYHKISKV